MNDFDDLTRRTEARKEIFRPRWFRKLLRGELTLGDTFWIGNIGVALVFVPITFIVALIATLVLPNRGAGLVMGALMAALCVYQIALTRAVWITARRTPEVGGWRWVGLGLTALGILSYAYYAWAYGSGGM